MEQEALSVETCQILFLGSPLLLAALAHGLFMKYEWLRGLKMPLDLGLHFRGKRIFGDGKTFRGLLVHGVFCTLGALMQARLQDLGWIPNWLPLLDYRKDGLLCGALLGLGMTLGELPNSFLKRQLNIPPGKKKRGSAGLLLFLFDQIDLAVGIWICLFFLIRPTWHLVFWSFGITLIGHVLVTVVGYLLGMRKTWV